MVGGRRVIEHIRAKSLGYATTMKLLEILKEAGMSSADAAVATNKPTVFYCYSPHHVLKLRQIKQLSELVFDGAKWNVVSPANDRMWLSKSKGLVAWEQSSFRVSYATSLSKRLLQVAKFFDNVYFTPDEVAAMSYALEVEQ